MINDILARSTNGQPEPFVGQPATILYANDRYPGTITGVESGANWVAVTVRRDKYRAAPNAGGAGHQSWIIEPDPDGRSSTWRFSGARRSAPSRWREVTQNHKGRYVLTHSGIGLRIGKADVYYCWEF